MSEDSLDDFGRVAGADVRWGGDVEDRIAATVHQLVKQVRD